MEKDIDYNSMDLSSEQKFLFLKNGKRQPQNERELKFLAECQEIEAKGYVVEIPHGDMV